jgi:hypothetical protein
MPQISKPEYNRQLTKRKPLARLSFFTLLTRIALVIEGMRPDGRKGVRAHARYSQMQTDTATHPAPGQQTVNHAWRR